MARNDSKKQGTPAPSASRLNFVFGLIAGIALVAAIAFFVRQKGTTPPPAAPNPATTTPSLQPPPPPPPQDFSETEVAAAARISVADAKRRIDEGNAIVIDVRDVDSYVAGHIPGALQIPLAYVQGEIPWFPPDKTLITYCT